MKTINISLFAFIFLFYSFQGTSQTKMIAHKSHGGTSANFKKALKSGNISVHALSNFGMAPQKLVRNSKLDSVILVNERTAVMITSESCHFEEYGSREKVGTAGLWSAGKDTVYDHPVFTGKNSVEKMKQLIKSDYFFTNSVDEIVFVGFEGENNKRKNVANKNAPITEKQDAENDELQLRKKIPIQHRSAFMIMVLSFMNVFCKCHF